MTAVAEDDTLPLPTPPDPRTRAVVLLEAFRERMAAEPSEAPEVAFLAAFTLGDWRHRDLVLARMALAKVAARWYDMGRAEVAAIVPGAIAEVRR